MTRYRCVLTTALALALAVIAGPEAALAKSNVTKVCKGHTHTGTAEHKIYDRAFVGALQTWVEIVTEHDGPSWAKINRGAPVQCENLAQSGADWWRCTVVFQPCRMMPLELPDSLPMPGITIAPNTR